MKNKECKHCLKILPISHFYKCNGRKNQFWTYCKECERIRKKQQLINFKHQCLNYKNQFSCSVCGYDKNVTALDFHHVNSNDKDFTISSVRKLLIDDSIKKELDKCQVLCSNCHREIHSLEEKIFTPKFLEPRSPSHCVDCQVECSIHAQRCLSCYKKHNFKQSKCPSKEQLIKDFEELKYFTKVAKKYNVSDNAVRKWCDKFEMR